MKLLKKRALSPILPLLLFASLAIQINQGLPYWSWDRSILLTIHETSQPNLDRLASFLTGLATTWGILPATVLLIGGLWLQQQWRTGFYVLATMAGASLISYSSKLFFHRVRPHFWELFFPLPSDYSFPSGHALFSLTFVLMLVVLTWESRWRWWVVLAGGLFVIAIAWTRLYLGVHYPSDILGGWSLAIAWTWLIRPLQK
jgi:membrane-associated phospholipid phosphatase